jgi:hypothetical protein
MMLLIGMLRKKKKETPVSTSRERRRIASPHDRGKKTRVFNLVQMMILTMRLLIQRKTRPQRHTHKTSFTKNPTNPNMINPVVF